MEKYLEDLNKEQLEAVLHTDGPLLVLAGAGSGKTKMLVSKLVYLIKEKQVPMSQILMLTFTNRAAKEMKARAEKALDIPLTGLFAGTFHSFCMNLLRVYAPRIGIRRDFTVLDPSDVIEILKMMRGEVYPEKDAAFPEAKSVMALFSAMVNKNQSLETILMENCPDWLAYLSELTEMQEKYAEYKLLRGYLDFDDLLFFTAELLEREEYVRFMLDEKYQYILTDEYQDTNFLQDKLLSLLTKDTKNITVVGDDNQSIYRFRGAEVGNILSFKDRYPKSHMVILHENYRSSQEILRLANEIMTCASEGIPKTLHGQFKTWTKPMFCTFPDENMENQFVLKEIKKRLAAGQKPEEIAVIIRSARHTLALETMLLKNKIPYNKYGGLKIFDRAVFRDIFAYLQAAQDERSELSWFRILQLYPGIGQKSARSIAADMFENGFSCTMKYTKKSYFKSLETAVHAVKTLSQMSLYEQIRYLVTGHYKKIKEESINNHQYKDAASANGKRLEEYTKFIKELRDTYILEEIAKGYASAKDFIADFILEAVEQKDERNAITITTIHSAKGLEFESVFLMNCADKRCPMFDYNEDNFYVYVHCHQFVDKDGQRPTMGKIEDVDDSEELRCFYVAITRAKKELILTYSNSYGYKSSFYNPAHYLWLTETERYMDFQ